MAGCAAELRRGDATDGSVDGGVRDSSRSADAEGDGLALRDAAVEAGRFDADRGDGAATLDAAQMDGGASLDGSGGPDAPTTRDAASLDVGTSPDAAGSADATGGTDGAITPASVIKLFDGSSLDGLYSWLASTKYEDPQRVFRVENGELRITGDGLGGILTHARYRDYHLILEFRWGDATFAPRLNNARDGGLLVHGNGADGGTVGDLAGRFKPSIQSQMLEGGMGDLIMLPGVDESGVLLSQSMTVKTELVTCVYRNWGCWEGSNTHRWKAAGTARTFTGWDLIHHGRWDPAWQDVKGFRGVDTLENPNGHWNQMVLVADGDTIMIYFNGAQVNRATAVSPAAGQIMLETEWAEHFVRRWELWPLGSAPVPINPDP